MLYSCGGRCAHAHPLLSSLPPLLLLAAGDLSLRCSAQAGPGDKAKIKQGAMAGIFGKIFVGIYVEIKRSDGTWLDHHTHCAPSGWSEGEERAPPTAPC